MDGCNMCTKHVQITNHGVIGIMGFGKEMGCMEWSGIAWDGATFECHWNRPQQPVGVSKVR